MAKKKEEKIPKFQVGDTCYAIAQGAFDEGNAAPFLSLTVTKTATPPNIRVNRCEDEKGNGLLLTDDQIFATREESVDAALWIAIEECDAARARVAKIAALRATLDVPKEG